MKDKAEEIEKMLEFGDMTCVRDRLEALDENEGDSEFSYYWGRYYNAIGEWQHALKYLRNAMERQPENLAICYELAYTCEKTGNISEAEQIYCDLMEEEGDSERKWTLYCVLADFYERHHMYLKMDRIGKKLIEEYPENYYGHHVRYMSFMERRKYKESEIYLQNMEAELKKIPQYIKDCVFLYETQDIYEKILQVLDENKDLEVTDQRYVYKKRILAYTSLEQYEKAEACLKQLVVECGDLDAMIGMAILLVSKGYYDRAQRLVDIMLDSGGKDILICEYYAQLICVMSIVMQNRNKGYVMNQKARESIDQFKKFVEMHGLQCEEILDVLDKFGDEIEAR